MPSSPPLSRACLDCNETLPLTEFHRNCRTRDGRACYCKPCMKLRRVGLGPQRLHRGRERVLARIAADLKRCNGCGETKRLSTEFYRSGHAEDGHTAYCKPCHVKAAKRSVDPAREKAYQAAYRARKRAEKAAKGA